MSEAGFDIPIIYGSVRLPLICCDYLLPKHIAERFRNAVCDTPNDTFHIWPIGDSMVKLEKQVEMLARARDSLLSAQATAAQSRQRVVEAEKQHAIDDKALAEQEKKYAEALETVRAAKID